MYVSETLGQFGARFQQAPVEASVLHHARRAVVDWYAALIAGYGMDPTPRLERAMAEDLDRGGARLALGRRATARAAALINRSEEHTSELQSPCNLVCRLLLEKKKETKCLWRVMATWCQEST